MIIKRGEVYRHSTFHGYVMAMDKSKVTVLAANVFTGELVTRGLTVFLADYRRFNSDKLSPIIAGRFDRGCLLLWRKLDGKS